MRVSVFGLGYVGSVTAACLARSGHEVVGVDVDAEKVRMTAAGRSPVVEPGLSDVIAAAVAAGRLHATVSPEEAVARSDVALVCVGTPSGAGGLPDVGALERVSEQLGSALRGRRAPFAVVVRSTVLPGTCERVVGPALRRGGAGGGLRLAVNPEFMREGSALRDFARPPFTLVGSDEAEPADRLAALFARVEAPFVRTSVRAAEMVKYVANAFHALKVCFANEVGDLCEAQGADVDEVVRVFLLDRQLSLSEAYLRPGFAFGGSCLPKDVRALVGVARAASLDVPLLASLLPSNERQIRRAVQAILHSGRRRVGVVGLAFKPGTDDLRESPIVALVKQLIGEGLDVRILDRQVAQARLVGANRRFIEREMPHVLALMCPDLDALLRHAEVLVVGSADADGARALARARLDQVVVDLTRGAARRVVLAPEG